MKLRDSISSMQSQPKGTKMLTRLCYTRALALCVLLGAGSAQAYPDKPIRLIVPSAAGGPTDTPARILSDILSGLGQPVVVENRPGAAGAIGARAVAGAQPDGHTLLVGNTSVFAVIPAVSKNAGYDPISSFAPVAEIAESYQVLVVHPSAPWRTVRELAEDAKRRPGRIAYAHTGPGGLPHLAMELLLLSGEASMNGIPFKSGGEVITALLGQHVDVAFQAIELVLPQIREGKLRALGVTSAARTVLAPEIPTLAEEGVPGYEVTTFQGISAPAGTPAEIVAILNAAIRKGLNTPAVREKLTLTGSVPRPGTPQDFARFLREQNEKWRALAQARGIATN
jgi:tripartite-type tricarboxylate transporter receptor subunit TctC